MTIACVELDVPVSGPFDYEIGHVDVLVGSIVVVPFGRRRVVGVVIRLADSSAVDKSRIRRIERILPIDPLPPPTLSLAAFCADYYRHRLGQVLSVGLPTMLRKPDFGKHVRLWEYALIANHAADLEANPMALSNAINHKGNKDNHGTHNRRERTRKQENARKGANSNSKQTAVDSDSDDKHRHNHRTRVSSAVQGIP